MRWGTHLRRRGPEPLSPGTGTYHPEPLPCSAAVLTWRTGPVGSHFPPRGDAALSHVLGSPDPSMPHGNHTRCVHPAGGTTLPQSGRPLCILECSRGEDGPGPLRGQEGRAHSRCSAGSPQRQGTPLPHADSPTALTPSGRPRALTPGEGAGEGAPLPHSHMGGRAPRAAGVTTAQVGSRITPMSPLCPLRHECDGASASKVAREPG